MKRFITITGAAVALMLSIGLSEAQLDLTGGSVAGNVTSELVGATPGNLSANNGSISSWAISGAAIDPNGLIFVYQVSNNGQNVVPNFISNIEVNGFNPGEILSTGSYASVTGLSLGGSSPSASGNFGTVLIGSDNVTFQGAELQGISYYLAIETDVSAFDYSYGQVAGTLGTTGGSFGAQAAPTLAPVPEANTLVVGALMLLPIGIGAVRAFRKVYTA